MATPTVQTPGRELEATWGQTLGCLWSAASCWFMAWLFFTAWWRPLELDGGRWVKLGVGIMVLEFILVHSGGIMHHVLDSRQGPGRWRALLGFTALYSLFGVGIALGFRSWWLFGSFAFVMSGRIASAFCESDAMDRAISHRRMVASVLLYLGLIFATLFLPLPRGGVSSALVNRVWPDRGDGAWERRPEKALAMGACYFLFLGLIEMRPPRRAFPR